VLARNAFNALFPAVAQPLNSFDGLELVGVGDEFKCAILVFDQSCNLLSIERLGDELGLVPHDLKPFIALRKTAVNSIESLSCKVEL